ncbi:uncharacterized protein LOC115461772 [Microcaecilia unicolor]|uniref:Uncharacterized protein LOC115461772 n=1 Tax=Microcaecilia unicolor TaxID=1415580 RepID=A0A6P7WWV4_9AMPH|nr:uncharacterized protein LOC115461772 [Microcaecilia unicolor]
MFVYCKVADIPPLTPEHPQNNLSRLKRDQVNVSRKEYFNLGLEIFILVRYLTEMPEVRDAASPLLVRYLTEMPEVRDAASPLLGFINQVTQIEPQETSSNRTSEVIVIPSGTDSERDSLAEELPSTSNEQEQRCEDHPDWQRSPTPPAKYSTEMPEDWDAPSPLVVRYLTEMPEVRDAASPLLVRYLTEMPEVRDAASPLLVRYLTEMPEVRDAASPLLG